MFGKFSYLIYMLIFTLAPIFIMWTIKYNLLRKNIGILLKVVIIAVIYQFLADPVAEFWKAWFFSEDKILGIWVINSFPLENTLFFILTSLVVSQATIILTDSQEKGSLKKLLEKIKLQDNK